MNNGLATASPNGDRGVDAQVSILAHEIVGVASDADGWAWYNSGSGSDRGYENGDYCVWTYGTTYTVTGTNDAARDGAEYNVVLGNKPYLIQRNFPTANAKSGGLQCALECHGKTSQATCTSTYPKTTGYI